MIKLRFLVTITLRILSNNTNFCLFSTCIEVKRYICAFCNNSIFVKIGKTSPVTPLALLLFIFSKLKELTVIAFHPLKIERVDNHRSKSILFSFSKLKDLTIIVANQCIFLIFWNLKKLTVIAANQWFLSELKRPLHKNY